MIERFWKYIETIPECGCWIWVGARTGEERYGVFWTGTKYQSTHRFSYEFYNGKIENGLFVLHKCDIPSCVNPRHLFLGSQSDNISDCSAKGRMNLTTRAIGENSGRVRLTEEQAIYVLKSSKTTAQLSRGLNISFQTLSCLRTGKSWKHLKRS